MNNFATIFVCDVVSRAPSMQSILEPDKRQFRFWIDYQVLSSPASAALIEKALVAVGGKKVRKWMECF